MTRLLTISGPPGSGTSTLCKLLAGRTGWRYVNAGQIFRDMAQEAGISLAEFGRRAEADGAIDRNLDARMIDLAADRSLDARADGCLLEGRVVGWMVYRHGLPALKVWVDADVATRIRRVAYRDGQTEAEATAVLAAREESERLRYAVHHGIDLSDLSIYDLVLDSVATSPEALADGVVGALPPGAKGPS